MELLTGDYLILAAMAVGAVLGAIGGFSGSLAFVVAMVATSSAARLMWPILAGTIASPWGRALTALVAVLLIFALVRMIVARLVGKLLAQPADAIFGILLGGLAGAALALAIAWVLESWGYAPGCSNLLVEVGRICPGTN